MSEIFKRVEYEPGDCVAIGSEKFFTLGYIVSQKLDGETYIVVFNGMMVRLHKVSIVGKYLSDAEKLKNIEGHTTKVLLDLQKCIQNNQILRKKNNLLTKEVKYLTSRCAYCPRL